MYVYNIQDIVYYIHTYIYIYVYTLYIYIDIVYINRIIKQRISFNGSQYGSCSTNYNTLPVTRVVYN